MVSYSRSQRVSASMDPAACLKLTTRGSSLMIYTGAVTATRLWETRMPSFSTRFPWLSSSS